MGTAIVSNITAVSEFLSWVMVVALLQALLLEVIDLAGKELGRNTTLLSVFFSHPRISLS